MIPKRYEGPFHCAGLMFREEGLRGLFRGYWAFMIATSIYWVAVPMASEIMFRKHPLSGNFSDQTNELLDDVNKLNQIKKAAGLRGGGGPKED